VEHVVRVGWGGREAANWVLVSKPEDNRSPGRPRGRWKNNIEMDFQHTIMGRRGED